MDGKSLDILSERLSKLKETVPEAFTENKIDWEKLKATLGENLNLSEERYHLNWAGKSEVFRVLQQRTAATLIPVKDESVKFDETENVFIEGENLEVLKVLQKSYFGKIKMIYIDPPYNTGNDSFIYPDRFSETKDEYLKRIGEKDEEGYLLKEGMFRKNTKESGHYHSNWLSMMYPRLYLARNLLRDDGVIFVSIDDNEVHNLRMIMNEIFGEENFIANIIWQRAFSPINLKKTFSESHDYILCYSKNLELINIRGLKRTGKSLSRYNNPDNDFRGAWTSTDLSVGPVIKEKVYPIVSPTGKKFLPPEGRCWVVTKERFEELKEDNRIWFGENGSNAPRLKKFLVEVKDRITPMTIWMRDEVGDSQEATRVLKELFDGKSLIEYPKSVRLLKRICELTSEGHDIILDFFAGSGTTAQAVLELNKEDGGNRKFILIQLPEKTKEDSEAYKAGYKTIADICKERIRRVIKKQKTENEQKKDKNQTELELNEDQSSENLKQVQVEAMGFKVFKLIQSNFKMWRSDIVETEKELGKMMDMFETHVKDGSKEENMLYELIIKSGYQLTDKIEKKKGYYSVQNGELIIVLRKIKQKQIDEIINSKPKRCIMLDDVFAENDRLKTNTALQMKDAEIEFRTV